MNKELIFSENYDSGKVLMETFGRGKMPRQTQYNFSERNNFERQKQLREKYSRNRAIESTSRNTVTFREKLIALDKQNDTKEESCHTKSRGKHANFGRIDEISEKINGIIRSISVSCHKHSVEGTAKPPKLQKSQTVQKLQSLQKKYNNSQTSLTKHKKTESKRGVPSQYQQSQIKGPSRYSEDQNLNNSGKLQGFYKASMKKYHLQASHDPNPNEQQGYDDINQRIQYINDKISKYQRKMSCYQEVYKSNKKTNEQYFNEGNNELTQNRDQVRDRLNLCKSEQRQDTVQRSRKTINQTNKGKFVSSAQEKYKEKNNLVQKQDIRHVQTNKKQGFFNEKYKELVESGKKATKCSEYRPETDKVHSQIKDTKKDQSKASQKKKIQPQKISKKSFLLPAKHQTNTGNKSTFIKSLLRQISLDQDFRHAKHMFGGMEQLFEQSSQTDHKRWIKLREQLNIEGISLSLSEVKHIFMPRDDEIDPFMSVSHSHQELVHGVIFAYQQAEKHWNDNFYHNWSFYELKQSNFVSERIDRNKRGSVSLEDLIFYINTEVDGFYRNRDLMLVFNRLGPKHGPGEIKNAVKFKEIVDNLLSL